ncbi:hypothetical protein PFISCL1PPCAC_13451, partial [Pristionchus fissidentatus]
SATPVPCYKLAQLSIPGCDLVTECPPPAITATQVTCPAGFKIYAGNPLEVGIPLDCVGPHWVGGKVTVDRATSVFCTK